MPAFYEDLQTTLLRIYQSDGITFPEHLHKQVEIIYVLEGEIEVTIGSETRLLYSGELGIIFPNVVHAYKTAEFCSQIILIFEGNLTGDYFHLLTSNICTTSFLLKTQLHPHIFTIIQTLLKEELNEETRLMKAYLSLLVGLILKSLQLIPLKKQENQDTIHSLLKYVTMNFKEKLTLDIISKEIGLDKSTISKIFNNELKQNFHNYRNNLRIGYAQHLLEDFTYSITDIAYECGFDSQRTFNRVFLDTHGVTPREYRKKLQRT